VGADWVAFDLETTGLGPTARPVEIGARRYRSDGVIEDFAMLVDPGVPIPAEVIAIHGITDEMVRGAPGVEAAMERFFTFAEDAALVAHNAAFDAGVLAVNAERLGMPLPPSLVYDSVRMARRLIPNLWSYRLSAVVRALDLEHGTFHRAHADAVMVGSLVRRLLGLNSQHLVGFPTTGVGLMGVFDQMWPVSVKGKRAAQSCVTMSA
jgi:DNA polymerase III epsilon subunit family exonuclease